MSRYDRESNKLTRNGGITGMLHSQVAQRQVTMFPQNGLSFVQHTKREREGARGGG